MKSSALKTNQKVRRKNIKVSTILLHMALVVGAIIMVFPFIWSILSSLKGVSQIFAVPPEFIPNPFVWSNYPDSLQAMPFGRAYWNSFYITILIVGIQLITASMAAYAFAKIRFPGINLIFVLFLATMMIPKQVTMVPTYMIMSKIGWLDTHLALIVPGALFNAFSVFLLRQFVMGIPNELEEAAIVDGANPFRVYWSVILPLIRPALAAVGIFSFMGTWNNFLEPLIYLSTPDLFTVPLMLNYFKGLYATDWGLMMAGSTISIIPVLIVYVIAQKHIIEGVALTGVKG